MSIKKNVISMENVEKQFQMGTHIGGRRSFGTVLKDRFKRDTTNSTAEDQYISALSGISLTFSTGEIIGLVGHNGSGKSTLLKLINRVMSPTSGICKTRGTTGSLLEVGAGFYMELTGRENIYIVGNILGMTRKNIEKYFHEIVEFAELDHRLLDTPVKRYSSGQYMRLAFSISAHLDADIMLVDEILAVGDQNFQVKCLEKIRSLGKIGKTTLFVSHQLYLVADICDRVIWLDHGKIKMDGPTNDVLPIYRDSMHSTNKMYLFESTAPKFLDANREPTVLYNCGQPIFAECDIKISERYSGEQIVFNIWKIGTWQGDQLVTNVNVDTPRRKGTVKLEFPGVLAAGTYKFALSTTQQPSSKDSLGSAIQIRETHNPEHLAPQDTTIWGLGIATLHE